MKQLDIGFDLDGVLYNFHETLKTFMIEQVR